jgi:hypothetical protein
MCATCRRPLIHVVYHDGQGNRKHLTYTHNVALPGAKCFEAVLIRTPESGPSPISLCDFCGGTGVTWSYPAADFDCPYDNESKLVGAWLSCEGCHAHVEVKEWHLLVDRWFLANGQSATDRGSRDLAALFDAFDAHRLGPAERLVQW